MRLLPWLLWIAAIPALTAEPIFTLDPVDGAVHGMPGWILSWRVSIQNDNSGWVVINSVTYDQTVSDQTVSIGDFADLLTPRFASYALPPSETWPAAGVWPILGTYVIDGSFAMPEDVATGSLHVYWQIHSQDPYAPGYDPFTDTITGSEALLPATVTYDALPEPASAALVLAGLALCGVGLRRARARSMKG